MKKILILLLLITTLTQAEEFKLVCEGERVLTKTDSDEIGRASCRERV